MKIPNRCPKIDRRDSILALGIHGNAGVQQVTVFRLYAGIHVWTAASSSSFASVRSHSIPAEQKNAVASRNPRPVARPHSVGELEHAEIGAPPSRRAGFNLDRREPDVHRGVHRASTASDASA